MAHLDSVGRDTDIDLESGETTTSEEDESILQGPSGEHGKKLLRRNWSGLSGNKSVRIGNGISSFDEKLNNGQTPVQDLEKLSDKLAEETMNSTENKRSRDKLKNPNTKRPPKPPRPPKGPLLDAADMKFVQEFSELAMLKRKRIERMKKLKKKRSEKPPSSNTNLIAFVVTIIFCFVIIFQGMRYSKF